MKFWDSSAIVPLVITETQSPWCQKLMQDDPEVIVWTLTPTEVYSALYRRWRQAELAELEVAAAQARLTTLSEIWSEVIHLERTRQRAHRLIAVHSLRAADALQLAAALIAFNDQPEGEAFITFDQNLTHAARKEGFKVMSEDRP